MKTTRKAHVSALVCALALAASAALVACGGGGGGSASSDPVTITGTAASGAPFPKGSTLTVTDAVGASWTFTVSSDDGSFSITLPATAKAPLVITASNEDLGLTPMVSVASELKTGSTVNVTPATHVIATLLAGGDPSTLAASIQSDPSIASASKVDAQKTAFTALATNLGVTDTTDPLNGKFVANGAGHDKALDSVISNIKISTDNTGATKLTINPPAQASSDTDAAVAPVEIVVAAKGQTTAMPSAATVATVKADPAKTIPDNTSAKLLDLLTRLSNCYAQPQATRVGTNTTSSATAAGIVSSVCKSAFYNNDPSTFKNNSYTVGAGSGSATWFSGIFTNKDNKDGTVYGVTYAAPAIQYIVKNGNTSDTTKPMDGDVVFTSRWTAPFDGVDPDTGAAKQFINSDVMYVNARAGSDGKLYLIGNLSDYDINVEPRAEFRDFAHANLSKYSYVNVGFNLYVNSKHNLSKVVATSPKGNQLTLKQITGGGYGYMGLTKPSEINNATTSTSTSVVRMAAQYIDSKTTSSSTYCGSSSNHPRDIDGGSFWTCDNSTTPKNWTDAELAAIGDQGTWKFELYDSSGSLISTEYRRTISRPPTIAELLAAKAGFPALTSNYRAQLVETSAATGGIKLSATSASKWNIAASGQTGKAAWGWTLASDSGKVNAWTPTNVKIYGKDSANNNAGFDDQVNVYSSWRKASISCSAANSSDKHCNASGGASSDGSFKAWDSTNSVGDGFGLLQINGYNSRRVGYALSVDLRGCINGVKPTNTDGSANTSCTK